MHDIPQFYSLNFVVQNDQTNEIVDGWLRSTSEIIDFLAPIPLNYYIKTRLNATNLALNMHYLFPGGRFLIARINVDDFNGKMPESLWNWFYGKNDAVGLKAAGLDALLHKTN